MSSLTNQIRQINNDKNLSIVEKNKRIQRLMCSSHETKSNLNKSCTHYPKKCARFQFSCCGIIDPCRRCHLERGTCSDVRVEKIQCNECDEIADLNLLDFKLSDSAKKCKKCGLEFGKFFCKICFIWTDNEITHCEKCGHCLKGKKEDMFHCDNCDVCFPTKNRDSHSCSLSISYRGATCAICLEKLYGSQKPYFALQCKHFVHSHCVSEYTENGKYNCPLCKKSIMDMKAQWDFLCTQIEKNPVPSDFLLLREGDVVPSKFGKFQLSKIENNFYNKVIYHGKFLNWNALGYLHESAITKNVYKNIFCNDCEKKCWTLFHFYGLMCTFCRGFNTQE
jgi:RING finger/CHY zinc finger protein 1